MSDSTFRTKVEPQKVIPTKPVDPADEIAVPTHEDFGLLHTYQEAKGHPYTAEYFELETVWSETPTLKQDINEIEGYLREQISKEKLKNDIKSGKQFLKQIEKKADIDPYASTNERIEKVTAYIEFLRKIE